MSTTINLRSWYLLVAIFILASCKKNANEIKPQLVSFAPAYGGPGDNVTIRGTGFNKDKTKSQITFNGLSAEILHATDTSFYVAVPANVTTGPIAVVTNETELKFITPFIVSSSYAPLSPLQTGDILIVGFLAELYKNGLRMDNYCGSPGSVFEIMTVEENDVYTAGYSGGPDNKSPYPTYWKNGIPTFVGNGLLGKIRGITVVNGHVHTVGYTEEPGQTHAKYWHDGIEEVLPSGNFNKTEAWDIAIVNNDVHIVGYGDSTAIYWKNGEVVNLPMAAKPSAFYSLDVHGNDIYIAGSGFSNNSKHVARYWKNGEPISLSDGSKNEFAFGIAVDNNDVYVVGEQRPSSGKFIAKYWKNGISNMLGDVNYNSRAIAVDASNGSGYITGHDHGAIKCWKNGTHIPFANPALVGAGFDIFVVK